MLGHMGRMCSGVHQSQPSHEPSNRATFIGGYNLQEVKIRLVEFD